MVCNKINLKIIIIYIIIGIIIEHIYTNKILKDTNIKKSKRILYIITWPFILSFNFTLSMFMNAMKDGKYMC